MSVINLIDCLPTPPDGVKRLLPKQKLFFDSVLDPKGARYVLYAGGVGSGKTIIGCLTMIALAAAYPGDYLVCRQFMPELRITTLKTFLEMCPKDLIHEYRVADAIVRIKSAGGKISNVIFRGLDEPDKQRSLNLNAAYIDESSQVSEEAFTLLQSRLRGAHVRKIYMTTNPAGHDWQYRMFVKQDAFQKEEVKKLFALIRAPSTENTFLPDDYVKSMLATYSDERLQREVMASFDAFEGAVYPEFRRDLHVIQPFAIPKQWTRVIGADHGFRNPTAWLWGAVDGDGNVYIYREFYEKEWLIEEVCNGKADKGLPGVMALMKGERIEQCRMDPSTKACRTERGGRKISDFELYQENLPSDFPLMTADNDVTSGIDMVKSFLKPHPVTNKPRLYIFSDCANTIEEMCKYKYKSLSHTQVGKQNEREEPYKHDDHAMDALRYLIKSQPEPTNELEDVYQKIKYQSLEGALYRDMQGIKAPKTGTDPFGM